MKPKTLPEMFFDRVSRSGDDRAVMTKRDGRWVAQTWAELGRQVQSVAAVIADWVAPGDIACILSENRPEWWVADLAVMSVGGVSAPIYPTSPPKDVAYIFADCSARVLFLSSAEQLQKVRQLRDEGQLPNLEHVIVFDDEAQVGVGRSSSDDDDEAWITSFSSVRDHAPDEALIAKRLQDTDRDTLAALIYTSGTTGEPKGVMLTHGNLLSNVEAAHVLIDYLDELGVPRDERLMLSFLPLSHSFERMAGYYSAIYYGFVVAFAESIAKLIVNMGEVRPTALISVPRIYEKLYARVIGSASTPVKRAMLDRALAIGGRHAEYRLANKRPPLWLELANRLARRVVFGKIHDRIGGRLRFALSGGAPLAPEIGRFLAAIGLFVVEGYGLSETSPVLSSNLPGAVKYGSVGKPFPGVEIKIADDGEILARGPNIMRGYYNKPEATAEVLDEEGWLRTGDIGRIDSEGFLFITDRKKELIKTAGGKYVAPQPIENQLKIHPLIEQAVIVGDRRKYCVALLVPDFEALEQQLGRRLPPSDRTQLGTDGEVTALYRAAVDEANAERGTWEQIKHFALLPNELTQQSGELTPSLKVKRRVVESRYASVIDALYAE